MPRRFRHIVYVGGYTLFPDQSMGLFPLGFSLSRPLRKAEIAYGATCRYRLPSDPMDAHRTLHRHHLPGCPPMIRGGLSRVSALTSGLGSRVKKVHDNRPPLGLPASTRQTHSTGGSTDYVDLRDSIFDQQRRSRDVRIQPRL